MTRQFLRCAWLGWALFWAGTLAAGEAPSAPRLLTTAAIQAIPIEEIAGYSSVQVRGVVTLSRERARLFFIEDSTGGIYCDISQIAVLPRVGTQVELRGKVARGNFLPILQVHSIAQQGPGVLPTPRSATAAQLFDGQFDGDLVRVTGHIMGVRFVFEPVQQWLAVLLCEGREIGMGLEPDSLNTTTASNLVGAAVAVTGVAGPAVDENRKIARVYLGLGRPDWLEVLSDPVRTARNLPVADPNQYPTNAGLQLVRLQGAVTATTTREYYLKAGRAHFRVIPKDGPQARPRPGDQVDVAGFLRLTKSGRQLDTTAQLALSAGAPPVPTPLEVEGLLAPEAEGALVTVEGDFLHRNSKSPGDMLVLRDDQRTFVVRQPEIGKRGAVDFETGTRLRVTGVVLRPAELDGTPTVPRLLMTDPHALEIVRSPPWTMARTMAVLGAMAAALAVGLIGLGISYRRLRDLNRRLEEARQELKALNSALEARIESRTAELKRANEQLNREIAERQAAQLQLTAREARYRLLVERMDAIVWEFDPKTDRFTYISPQAARLGYPLDHWLVPGFLAGRIHPGDRAVALEHQQSRSRAGRDPGNQFRLQTANGGFIWVDEKAAVDTGPDGSQLLRGVFIDITIPKLAEIALRESEERFASAFRASPALIVITRQSDARYIDVNDRFVEVIGYRREEVIGRTSLELGLWVDLSRRQAIIEAIETGQKVRDFECTFRNRSGAHLTMLTSIECIVLGGERCLLGINHDITRRKRTEDAFRALAAGTSLAPADEFFPHLARSLAEIFGTRYAILAEQCPGKPDRATTLGVTADGRKQPNFERALSASPCADALSAGFVQIPERVQERFPEDKLMQDLEVESYFGLAIQDSQRQPIGLIAILHDTALQPSPEVEPILRLFAESAGAELERRRSQAALQAAEAQLRQAQRIEAIGTLAGGIAHDFNNILGSIIGFSELARRDARAIPAAVENLTQVLKASHRAKDLVHQLLTFSRHQEFQRVPLRLDSLLAETVGLLRTTLPESVELITTVAQPAPVIVANPTLIQQVLVNLVTNAVQAVGSRPGRIEINIATRQSDPTSAPDSDRSPELPDPCQAWIRVRDNGTGIAPNLKHRIFEPFFTTKGPGEGTGLGLSVVHGIIRAHGGIIHVESQLEVGTTFNLRLPALAEAIGLPPESIEAPGLIPTPVA